MKHKLIGTFLGALLIATVTLFGAATPSYAEATITKDGITYFLDEQSATAFVYGYDETLPGSIVIPESVFADNVSYSVTSIGDSAFYGCASLESVRIPDGVTSIGSSAFSGCTSLESVVFAGSPTSLNPHAFEGCTSLQNIFIPKDATLAADAFSGAEGSPLLWRYEVAGDSSDGKVHVNIVSVTDKDGSPITETVSIPQDIMGSGYVIDETPENVTFGQPYNVWVAGIQVTSLNADDVLGSADEGATVIYDAKTKTLTLNNANIAVDDSRFAIYAEQDLTISLVGTNSVTLSGSVEINGLAWESALDAGYTVPEPAAPIACKGGSLTIRSDDGNGSLKATNGADIVYENDRGSLMSAGIVATGAIRIENTEVEATANYTYETKGVDDYSYGIFAGRGVVMDDASVMAASYEAIQSAGVYALTGDISLNGNIVATGDRAVNNENPYSAFSAGIYASEGSVNIEDGSVGATAASLTEGGAAYGIFGYSGISITDGTVHAIGATSNMDGVDPLFGAGLFSSAGNIAISGKNTQVEADGGYASDRIAGIYANAGDIIITDASVKASAQNLYRGNTAVGIYAGKLQIARSGSATGNIVLSGADVQTVGDTDPVRFSGSLTVTPADGMWYSVDALDEAQWEYSGLLWESMAAAAQGIQGSPFTEETSLDRDLVSDGEYLHFYNVAAEDEENPTAPETPDDPTVTEDSNEPEEASESESGTDSKLVQTGDNSLIAPLTLVACAILAIGAGAAIRRKSE